MVTVYNQGLRILKWDPYSKVHGSNMGPTWVLSAPGGPIIGPMSFALGDVPATKIYVTGCDSLISLHFEMRVCFKVPSFTRECCVLCLIGFFCRGGGDYAISSLLILMMFLLLLMFSRVALQALGFTTTQSMRPALHVESASWGEFHWSV